MVTPLGEMNPAPLRASDSARWSAWYAGVPNFGALSPVSEATRKPPPKRSRKLAQKMTTWSLMYHERYAARSSLCPKYRSNSGLWT